MHGYRRRSGLLWHPDKVRGIVNNPAVAGHLFDDEATFSANVPSRDRAVPVDRIQPLYAALATDEQRNRLILDDIATALAEGRSPILLTERKDHLEFLAVSFEASPVMSSCFAAA